jgi:hypothetical protein
VRERCRRSEAAMCPHAGKAPRGERVRIEDQKRRAAETASISNEDEIQESTRADFPTFERRAPRI